MVTASTAELTNATYFFVPSSTASLDRTVEHWTAATGPTSFELDRVCFSYVPARPRRRKPRVSP